MLHELEPEIVDQTLWDTARLKALWDIREDVTKRAVVTHNALISHFCPHIRCRSKMKKGDGVKESILRGLAGGCPVHIDKLHDFVGCERKRLHTALEQLSRTRRIRSHGIGLWGINPVLPLRFRRGDLSKALQHAMRGVSATVPELSVVMNADRRTIHNGLNYLVRKGLAVKDGKKYKLVNKTK